MKYLLSLALHSAWNRRFTLGLTLLSIALATSLLVGIERLRHDVRESFAQSVSGTDLVVGARGSAIQLMLYSVFRLGDPSQNMRWQSAQRLAAHRAVAWTVPISLGDSHHGYPVVATNDSYFDHYHYGDRQALSLAQGRRFDGLFEAVLGAQVAQQMGYTLGSPLVLSHGNGEMAIGDHDDKPFHVVGILAATGTPVDRSVHISLESMEALHVDWQGGMPLPGFRIPPAMVKKFDLTPKTITAVLVGLKRRSDVFAMQRQLAEQSDEPLMGVMPGVTLDQLWQVIGVGERALVLISALVGVVGLSGLIAVILASLDARRRELAILRSVGASPRQLLCLLALEGLGVTVAGVLAGVLLCYTALATSASLLQARYGVTPSLGLPQAGEWTVLGAILLAGCIASLLPGWRAYRLSLIDGLSPRL